MSNESPSEPITGLPPHELLLGGLGGAGGERLGAYELIEPIGEGGMGVVYLAEQHEPIQREVALKLVKRGMDTDALLARFELERQTLAGLDHPNIARVFDAGATPAGRPYFVMELVEGDPITAFADGAGLGRDGRIALFLQACAAVEHAHRRGVIHRDLKPSNLLVDSEGVLKVIDFGLAKLTRTGNTGGQTLAGEVFGTPGFMAPEQEAGGDVDTRADVFALGRVLAELVGDEGELRWVAAKASDDDVGRRYGSVTELADDLRRFLDHRPLTAGPPSTLYRAGKFVRRHRAGCAVAAAVALGGGLALWKSIESARFKQRAEIAFEGQQVEWNKAHNANVFLHELLVAMDNDDPVRRRHDLRTAVHYYEQNLLEPAGDLQADFLVNEMLGLSYKALGEFDDALRCLDRASQLGRAIDEGSPHLGVPPWHVAERSLAEVLIRTGDFDHAAGILDQLDRETASRAGREYPERRVLLVLLAQAFEGAGMGREAAEVRDHLDALAHFDLGEPTGESP